MSKYSKCRFNFEKVRMDYSCHGRYKSIHIVFSLFSLLISKNKPQTDKKLSTYCQFRWSQSIVFKKVQAHGNMFIFFLTGGKWRPYATKLCCHIRYYAI